MIKLITLEDEKPVFNPEVRMFEPFRKIIERDKGSKGDADGRKKAIATKELAFIYWFADPRSTYNERYRDEKERYFKVKAIVGLPEDWEADDLIRNAIDFYLEEVKGDFDIGFLEDAIKAASELRSYFRTVDFTEKNPKTGALIHDPVKLSNTLKNTLSNIETLKAAREKVYKSIKNVNVRGGGQPGRYED